MYQKEWIETLNQSVQQYSLSKKELITLNRFDYKISDIKKFAFAVQGENEIPIYYSDKFEELKGQKINILLTQITTSKTIEFFDIQKIASFFHSKKLGFSQDLSVLNSVVQMNNERMNEIMENPRFHARSNKDTRVLEEQSMMTAVCIDETTKLDLFVKLKRFSTAADGHFSLVVLAEVDLVSKMITGRYIIMKLNEVKDLDLLKTKQAMDANLNKSIII